MNLILAVKAFAGHELTEEEKNIVNKSKNDVITAEEMAKQREQNRKKQLKEHQTKMAEAEKARIEMMNTQRKLAEQQQEQQMEYIKQQQLIAQQWQNNNNNGNANMQQVHQQHPTVMSPHMSGNNPMGNVPNNQ